MGNFQPRNRCRHFPGFKSSHCLAGVPIAGRAKELPCCRVSDFSDINPDEIECPQCDRFTDAEVASRRENAIANFKLIGQALETIAKTDKNVGAIDCPKCGGMLQYSRSTYNRHVHGYCLTENCLKWVQ